MQNLVTYSILKVFINQGKDYFGTIIPFIEYSLESNKRYTITKIQKKISEKLGQSIPINVIKSALKRMKRNDKIKIDGKYYILVRKNDKQEIEENIKTSEREIREIINSFTQYTDDEYDYNSAKELIMNFIRNNINNLSKCFKSDYHFENIQLDKKKEKELLGFLIEMEKNNERLYKIFRNIISGSIISLILSFDDNVKINNTKEHFNKLTVYLDTNIIFSLLGLHNEDFNIAARELIRLLKQREINIKVFDFTLYETKLVLNGYKSESNKYLYQVEVDSIYYRLKKKRINISDIHQYIRELEVKLDELGIKIEDTDINLNKELFNEKGELADRLKEYKPSKGNISIRHDIEAISYIQLKRKNHKVNANSIQHCKYIFLTSDEKLFEFTKEYFFSDITLKITPVILDVMMTNIIWMKNPEMNIPLEIILGLHSKELLINNQVWLKFYDVIQKTLEEGKYSDSDIAQLIYDHLITKTLADMDSANESDIIKLIDNAIQKQRSKQKENERRIEKVEKMNNEHSKIIDSLNSKITESEKENENLVKKMLDAKEENKKKAEKRAERERIKLQIGASIALGIIALLIILIIDYKYLEKLYAYLVVLGSFGFPQLFHKCFNIFENHRYNTIRKEYNEDFSKILER